MSADREASQDMTDRDIALLLADAADGVEIGIAPTQAVIRGGRRRRTRRWAVGAAVALALAGSTGTLAAAGLTHGDGNGPAQVATQPPAPKPRHVDQPRTSALAIGFEDDKRWEVDLQVWDAPRDKAEAESQFAAMALYGLSPAGVSRASDLVGRTSYSVSRIYGDADKPKTVMFDTVRHWDSMTGKDIEAAAIPLTGSGGPQRLVIGQVAKTAREVTCRWKDGTSTAVRLTTDPGSLNVGDMTIRPADGSPVNWFVCLASKDTAYKSVEVTK